jgi:hypothetical protein
MRPPPFTLLNLWALDAHELEHVNGFVLPDQLETQLAVKSRHDVVPYPIRA